MRLGIAVLDQGSTLNSLKYLNQVQFNPGETGDVYFQLVDLDAQINPNASIYQRYMPGSGSVLNVDFAANSNSNAFQKVASNPFPSDLSIWKISLSASDTAKLNGVNMKMTLTDGSSVKIGYAVSAIVMAPSSPYQC